MDVIERQVHGLLREASVAGERREARAPAMEAVPTRHSPRDPIRLLERFPSDEGRTRRRRKEVSLPLRCVSPTAELRGDRRSEQNAQIEVPILHLELASRDRPRG